MEEFELSQRMINSLKEKLKDFHKLLVGNRCSDGLLEELVTDSINADSSSSGKARWAGASHKADFDIEVISGSDKHLVQIKSGQLKDEGGVSCGFES